MLDGKKVLYSGMQATGTLTLGNYLGALKNWVELTDEYECIYGVMDPVSYTHLKNYKRTIKMKSSFNKPQSEAITHGKGPALILAGPGSGKTLVITQRVKNLIEKQHIRPSNILVITFTKAAATQMKERFTILMGEGRYPVTRCV